MRLSTGAALALLVLLALLPVNALGAEARARAHAPVYDTSRLELLGSGGYRNPAPHLALRVNVCLRHRVGGQYFEVRCASASAGKGRRVTAAVSVPGCVKGRWRTAVVGETLYRRGGPWTSQDLAVSRPFRC